MEWSTIIDGGGFDAGGTENSETSEASLKHLRFKMVDLVGVLIMSVELWNLNQALL